MPDVQTGAVRVDTIQGFKIPVDMDENIRFQETSGHRFELMTRLARPVDIRGNMKTEWMEHEIYPNTFLTTGASAGTTVPVDRPEIAHRDQLIQNMVTGEIYLMNEDVGGTGTAGSITVVNHSGSGNIDTATVAGQLCIIHPEVHAEGEDVPPAFTSKPVQKSTYIQQSDETLKVTDLAQNHDEYGMRQYKIDMKQKWLTRKRGINLSLLISKPMREIVSASGPRRHTSQGLRDAITTNMIDLSGPGGSGQIDLPLLGELLRYTTINTSTSPTKVAYAGQNAIASLSAIPVSQILTSVTETKWGKKLTSVVTPYGDLAFDHDRALTDQNGLADVFIITDPKTLNRLEFRGCPQRMIMNINGTTDFHNLVNLFTGTWGLKVTQEYLNAWVYGIQ
jgi:hypothetical protein